MSKILIRTNDEEPNDLLIDRVDEAIRPELDELDTTNKEYLITIEVTELP